MSSVTRVIIAVVCLASFPAGAQGYAHREILKKQIIEGGFMPSAKLYQNADERLVPVGKVLFESKGMSLNGEISCKTCHLMRFGSADGIPVASAIRGQEEGPRRLLSGGKLLPRNTLALWGRGAVGFDAFFWDGRVDFSDNKRISPFGSTPPSADTLVTAIHLPPVEIREMLDEDEFVVRYKTESVDGAKKVYAAIASNLRRAEPVASQMLADLLGKKAPELTFLDYSGAVAAFIRSEFQIKPTKLEKFLAGQLPFSDEEVRGGIVFYGKGRCASCHSGPHFSDFKYHTVAFPQLGFGKSGFGIDYGRYETTFNPKDLYKFRTPPLLNVSKTPPYGHSGSLATLNEAIVAHFDPLALIKPAKLDPLSRHEFYKRLTLSSAVAMTVGYLSREEVSQLVAFLKTLEF